jgi:hypothetical protein
MKPTASYTEANTQQDKGRSTVMDFLKSAVASAISKGPAFPYAFGERVDIDQSIWTLHNGTKRVGILQLPSQHLIALTDGITGRLVSM